MSTLASLGVPKLGAADPKTDCNRDTRLVWVNEKSRFDLSTYGLVSGWGGLR